jgi:GxxExxY protein
MTEILYPELSYQVQGTFYAIHNELRYLGLSEKGWESALLIALTEQGIAAQRQVEYEVRYKRYRVGRLFADVVVDDKMLIELKVRDALLPIDQAQVLTYLRVSELKLGMLVNFGTSRVEVKRIPNFMTERAALPPEPTRDAPADHLLYPELTGTVRALLYEVHSTLGPGLMPMHYRRALRIELRGLDIPHEARKEISLRYHGQELETAPAHFLIVEDKVLVLPVAVRNISTEIRGRAAQYLRLLGLRIGLVANFHAPELQIRTVRV